MFNKDYWIQRKIDRLHIKRAGYVGEMESYNAATKLSGWHYTNMVSTGSDLKKVEKRIEILTAKLEENK